MTKKNIFILIVALTAVGCLSLGLTTQALDLTNKLTGVGTNAGFSQTAPSLATTIGQVIKGLLSLLGVIFMGYIIYAGYIWMIARGREEEITKAKAILRGSIIGLIIVLAAYAITAFVVNQVTTATGYEQTTNI